MQRSTVHLLHAFPWPGHSKEATQKPGISLFEICYFPVIQNKQGLREKYGDVITLDLPGGEKMVFLNSSAAIQEGFIKNADKLSERHESQKGILVEGSLVSQSDKDTITPVILILW